MNELRPDFEEILEIIWMITEDINQKSASFEDLYKNLYEVKEFSEEQTKSLLVELINLKFINPTNSHFNLSEKGYKRARGIIRRHRLFERLFVDVLRMDETKVEKEACTYEHVIAEEVEDRICTLLGHPTHCPHNLPIPPGPCCKQRTSQISSIIAPVTELEIGETGIIAYISSKDNREMDKLLAFGILPGNPVKLHQRMPLNGPIVIQIDQTQVALEKTIADQISVRRTSR